jgi:hypothetical protein
MDDEAEQLIELGVFLGYVQRSVYVHYSFYAWYTDKCFARSNLPARDKSNHQYHENPTDQQ